MPLYRRLRALNAAACAPARLAAFADKDRPMKRNWLLVANAARARVLEETDEPGRYAHVADLAHPQSRMKSEQLGEDRARHVEGVGHGLGSAAYQPRTDPHEREHDRFAREVATALNDGVAQGRCAGLTLVASDPFLGLVKSHLDRQSRKLVLHTVAHDYTHLRDEELARCIAGKGAATPTEESE
jgi:protein required for attachment to host cells